MKKSIPNKSLFNRMVSISSIELFRIFVIDMIIKETNTIFDSYLKVHNYVVDTGKETFNRELIYKKDAVAVLLYNTDINSFVMVEQPRIPFLLENNSNDFYYEVPAGLIDKDNENIYDVAIREVLEETGYEIDKNQLKYITWVFSDPGTQINKLHLFIAKTCIEQKVGNGGGLESEHENIKVINILYKDIYSNFHRIRDNKTLLLLNLFRND